MVVAAQEPYGSASGKYPADLLPGKDDLRPLEHASGESGNLSPDSYTDSEASTYTWAGPQATPQIQFSVSRMHHFGRKLAFWKKKPKTASDVYSALNSAKKSHERYRNDMRNVLETTREWSEYLSPPVTGRSQDLMQHMMMDSSLSEWLLSILDTIKPVTELSRKNSEIHLAMLQSFEIIKREEASIKMLLRKQNSAERHYFKAMADNWSEADTQRLNQERIRLGTDVDNATEQFRATCRRELPLRYAQLAAYYERLGVETAQSARSLEQLLNPASIALSGLHTQHSFYTPISAASGYMSSPPISVGPLQMHRHSDRASPREATSSSRQHERYEPLTPTEKTEEKQASKKVEEESINIEPSMIGDFVWSN